jgi:hypothetical protein
MLAFVLRALANRPVVVLLEVVEVVAVLLAPIPVVPRLLIEGRVAAEDIVLIFGCVAAFVPGLLIIDSLPFCVVAMRAEGVGTMEWRCIVGFVTPRSIGCERMEEDLSGLLYCCVEVVFGIM